MIAGLVPGVISVNPVRIRSGGMVMRDSGYPAISNATAMHVQDMINQVRSS